MEFHLWSLEHLKMTLYSNNLAVMYLQDFWVESNYFQSSRATGTLILEF